MSFISSLRFSASAMAQRLVELRVELGVGVGRLVPGFAGAVGEREDLDAERTHVPVGHRAGILRPVVPEGRARQHGALHLDAGLAHLRGDGVAGVLVPVLVDRDQLDARSRPGRLRPSAPWPSPMSRAIFGSSTYSGWIGADMVVFGHRAGDRRSRAAARSRCRPPAAARCAPSGRHRACWRRWCAPRSWRRSRPRT